MRCITFFIWWCGIATAATQQYSPPNKADQTEVHVQKLLQSIQIGCPLLWDESAAQKASQAAAPPVDPLDLESIEEMLAQPVKGRKMASTLTLGDVAVAILSGFLGTSNISRLEKVESTSSIVSRLLQRLSTSAMLDLVGLSRLVICFATRLAANPQPNVGALLCGCLDASPAMRETTCDVVYAISTGLSCLFQDVCGVRPVVLPYIMPLDIDDPRLNLDFTTWRGPADQVPHWIADKEMVTYYLLHKAMELVQHDVTLSQCDQEPTNITLAGWDTVVNINLVSNREQEGNLHHYSLPFARLAKRTERRTIQGKQVDDYMITVRGTSNPAEWAFDFAYDLVPAPSPAGGTVLVHRGFLALAAAISASCRPYLKASHRAGNLGRINIVGYSLGAGVCGALGLIIAAEWPSTPLELALEEGQPRVRTLLIAPPRVGTQRFNRDLASHTILRVLLSEYDPVPYVPCQYMSGCTAAKVPIPTVESVDKELVYVYGNWRNIVAVPTAHLPSVFDPEHNGFNLLVWHICSYPCWVSLRVDPNNPTTCFPPAGGLNYTQVETCPYMSALTSPGTDSTWKEFREMVEESNYELGRGNYTWLPTDNETHTLESRGLDAPMHSLLKSLKKTVEESTVVGSSMLAASPIVPNNAPELLRKALTQIRERIVSVAGD